MIHLPYDKALEEGAQLWIVPDRKSSFWSRRMDWHLQFLISRSMIHKTPELSAEMQRIVAENEIQTELKSLGPDAPLLIFCVNSLPNRALLHLPYNDNFNDWLKKAQRQWERLGKPTARIFLPRNQDVEDFKKVWSKSLTDQISVVIDMGGH